MIKCKSCGAENPMSANFCETCGASFADVQDALREADADEAEELLRQTKAVSTALFWVGGLIMVSTALLGLALDGDNRFATMVSAAVIGSIIIGLGFWAKRSPMPASIVTLVLLGFLWLADAIVDPTSLANGIVVKIIVIVVLTRAIKASLRYRQLKAEGRIE